MKPICLTRITMGTVVIAGLLLWHPLAYLAGAMMIFAGLTGVCLLEKLFAKLPGGSRTCSRPSNGSPSEVPAPSEK
ncbi:MAG: hypothetical protein BIFFINMI_04265 [Phycisphaerae bacterium]|nr:hypothetical protein [Phycisphaerae bacterium]